MPRLLEPLNEEEKEAAKRMIQAFNAYEAFVFEIGERKLFYNVIRKAGLEPLIIVREASRRKPLIYVILLNDRPCRNECNYQCRAVEEGEKKKCIEDCMSVCMENRKKYLIEALDNAIKNS